MALEPAATPTTKMPIRHEAATDWLLAARPLLLAYLPRQRWFGAKDRQLSDILSQGSALLEARNRSWRLALLEARYADGSRGCYFLALASTSDAAARCAGREIGLLDTGARLQDAATDSEFIRAVVDAMQAGTELSLADGGGQIRFSCTSASANAAQAMRQASIRALGAEQSNSSIAIQDFAVLKFYRRVQAGISPEIEMTRFLTQRGYRGTPPLLGAIELMEAGRPSAGLGVLTAWTANHGDAWDGFALAHLRRTLRSAANDQDAAVFLQQVAKLAERTAELHRALCPEGAVDSAFMPEPIRTEDVASWRAQVRAEAEAMLASLSAAVPRSHEDVAAQGLLQRRGRLLQHIDEALAQPIQALRTRVHGDYHLGQVLFTGEDFRIIDFEGEPRRPVEERRTKSSPLKDVAGMLRSFAYAAAAALRELPADAQTAQARALVDRWRCEVGEAFLSRYRSAMAGCGSYPADETSAGQMLRLFLLEKAIYEVRYELANRPDWLTIPIGAILELLDAPQAERP